MITTEHLSTMRIVKKIAPLMAMTAILCSCGSERSEAEQKAYTDSLFHVISCSPTMVHSAYTLEDQLNACNLLIKEYPKQKEKFENVKSLIREQIRVRDSEFSY